MNILGEYIVQKDTLNMVLLSSSILIASMSKSTSSFPSGIYQKNVSFCCLKTIYSPLTTPKYFAVPHLFDIVQQINIYHTVK